MLEGLDDVPWERLTHAYGKATDVPDLLRALARGKRSALDEFYGNIWHQGTVYEATSYAVPFLVEILTAPKADKEGILGLLSSIAWGSSYADVHQHFDIFAKQHDKEELDSIIEKELRWVRAARDTVAAGAPTYTTLLTTGTPEVRKAAAQTIGASVDPSDPSVSALRECVVTDDDLHVRATAILALGRIGAVTESDFATWRDLPEPLLRLLGAIVVAMTAARGKRAAADGGSPSDAAEDRPKDLPEDVIAVIERDAPLAATELTSLPEEEEIDEDEELIWILGCLNGYWNARMRLLLAWLRHEDPDIRRRAVYACGDAITTWRPAAKRLVGALAERLTDEDEDVQYPAASHLARAGRAVAAVADDLWALVQRGPVADRTMAASALRGLCRLGDRRAGAYLAERLTVDPVDLSGIEDLLRHIERPWGDECRDALIAYASSAPAKIRYQVVAAAARLCAGDPASARSPEQQKALAAMVPTVRKEIESNPHTAIHVLVDLAMATEAAIPELRALLEHEEPDTRIGAALGLWKVTGDTDALLPLIHAQMAPDTLLYNRLQALKALAELATTEDGRKRVDAGLVERLSELLASEDEDEAIRAAMAYWRLTRNAEPVVPVLLKGLEPSPFGIEIARFLGEIGPGAAEAAPKLREGAMSEYRQYHFDFYDTRVINDEKWARACAEALDRIAAPLKL